MKHTARRAARFRHLLTFAILVLQGANLAYSASPDITLSATTIDFKYIAGTPLPAAQTLNIKSTGTALNFTIPAIASQWLSVSVNTGITPAALKVYVNPTSMASGAYQGTFTVDAPSAVTTSTTVTVTMEISDPTPTLSVNPTTLSFTYVTDQLAPTVAQQVLLTSTGGAVTSTVVAAGGTWLFATPSGAISLAGIPSGVTVSVNPANLANGSYAGTVKITPSVKTILPITINVSLKVNPGSPDITNLWPLGALVNSPATVVTVTGKNFFPTSTVATGTTAIKGVTYVSPTTLLVTIPAGLLTTAVALPLAVTTPSAAASSTPNAKSTFQVYTPGPQILTVTDGASFAPIDTISPGEIITIYGLGLGPASLATLTVKDPLDTSLPLPAPPPAVTPVTVVTIDGVAAPLLYTSATQVSCIVPFVLALQSGKKVDVSVTYNSIPAATAVKVDVVDANPGLFTTDSSGAGQGAILNYNPTTGDYSLNSATNPAVRGTTWAVLYLTGYGVTNCADIAATGSTPASNCNVGATEVNLIAGAVTPSLAIAVTIDGQPAPGALAQAPLGSVPGLMQVNVLVPASVKKGAVVVSVQVGTGAGQVSSQAKVTLATQ